MFDSSVEQLFTLPRMAQGGADTGHELHHPKGLGDVVVRPAVQAHHLVVLGPLGGDQDDGEPGGGGAGADALEDVQAVLQAVPEGSGRVEVTSYQTLNDAALNG